MTRTCVVCRATIDGYEIDCPKCGGKDTLEIALRCADCGAEVPYSESVTLRSRKKSYCNECVRERMVWLRDFLQNDGQARVQFVQTSV